MFTLQAKSLWAKKRDDSGHYLWLPLITHLWDTELIINQLYNHWLSQNQRDILTTTMSEDLAQRLVKFLGATHDIGKATAVFEDKPSYSHSRSLDEEVIERLESAGFHGLEDAKMSNPERTLHALAGEAILLHFGVPESLAAIIGGHHGKPLANPPKDNITTYRSNYWQSDNNPTEQQPWKQVQMELFDWCLSVSGLDDVQQLPEVSESQAVILEGLLIMADWLASSEYLSDDPDKPLFPLISMDETFDDIDETLRYQQAWTRWNTGLNWDANIDWNEEPYYQRWNFHPRPVQQTITNTIQAAQDPGIMIIEAPMGVGKTEVALLAAEQLADKCGQNGLFFGLPTQATTNAMFDRVKEWLQVQTNIDGENLSIHLMHGRAIFNQSFQELPSAQEIDVDSDNKEPTVVVNSWFGGKKTILDEFTIGTIDHLLLMALKQKHLALRHLGLSKKVVILDEIHASDAYMDQYLFEALQWLGAYHVPVILLSATLPATKRKQLIDAYYCGKYGHKLSRQDDSELAPVDWQTTDAYPLFSILDGKQLHQITDFPGKNDQAPLNVKVTQIVQDDSQLIERVLSDLNDGGIAGIIVNTVKRAQALEGLLRDRIETLVLHSAFLATDRSHREDELQTKIGKGADRPTKLVVIGTQILEQSLDIDFDILYTDMAPMDLILQRAGRLHRHHINRPAKLQQPQLVIMDADQLGQYSDANQAVYPPYLLTRTHWLLPDTLRLPDDISKLVQQVYDFDEEPPVAEIESQKEAYETQLLRQKKRARAFRLRTPNKSKTIHDWLGDLKGDVDRNEQLASAAVRDIEETIEVVLLQKTQAGIKLIDGRSIQDVAAKDIAMQVIRLPAAITRYHFEEVLTSLEKQTLTAFPDWQSNAWLKGALAFVLDDELSGVLNRYRLQYKHGTGLSYTKEEEDGGTTV